MRSFLRSSLTRTSIVALALAGCSTVGCGDDTSGLAPEDLDTGIVEETGDDTSSPPDSTEPDTTTDDTGTPEDSTPSETSADGGDDGGDTSVVDSTLTETSDDTGGADTATDDTATADTATADTATADTAIDDASDTGSADASDSATADADAAPACTEGALCADKSICTGGVCTDCTTDTACSTIATGTLCIAGKCIVAECKPPSATGCATTGSLCCATAAIAGKCVAPVTGKTTCCSDTECAAAPGGLTKCDTATNTCTCPDPTPGTWYVGPTGNDTSGNGSAACPLKTVTKAIEKTVGATAATTIVLQKGTTAVTTYGGTCTGGAPCDASPILVPSTVTAGLVIKGAGATSEVVVTGAGNNVFGVSAPGVGFESMTITPTKTALAGAGGHGIVYDYATAGTESAVKNVTISGTLATSAAAGTGSAIVLKGAAAPTIGTGVRLTGGFHGVLAEGTSAGKISGGPTAAQTIISNFGGACVYVTSASTTAAPMLTINSTSTTKDVIIRDCGTAGGLVIDTAFAGAGSMIELATISRSTTALGFPGISLSKKGKLSVKSITATGLASTGILAANNASLVTLGGVDVSSNGTGIYGTNFAALDLDGVTASGMLTGLGGTGPDGVRCDASATLKIRNSTTLSNAGNGVVVAGACVPDFTGGNNVFNKTSAKNLGAGVCLKTSGVSTVDISTSTFSCNYLATGCDATGTLSPTEGSPPGLQECKTGVDVSEGGVAAAEPGAKCCN